MRIVITCLIALAISNFSYAQIAMGGNNVLTAEGGIDFIDFDWSDAPDFYTGITGYELQQLDPDMIYQTVETFSPEITSYTHIELATDMLFEYRLVTTYVDAQTANDDLRTGTLPHAPTNFSAIVDSPVEVSLSWDDNSAIETGYTIERSQSEEGPFQEVLLEDPDASSATDESASPETFYFYRVGAVGVSGTSYSSLAEVTTDPSGIIYVDGDVESTGDGTSWENAFERLEEALQDENTGNGDQIWVATTDAGYQHGFGEPSENSNYSFSHLGLQFYGGFEGGETSLEERDEGSYTTFNGVIPDNNINNLFTISAPAISTISFDGFVFQNIGDNSSSMSGAVFSSSASLKISHCQFNDNYASRATAIFISTDGTGINLEVTNTTFSNNQATEDAGGAIYFNSSGYLTISDCTFDDNSTTGEAAHGGAIYFSSTNDLNISGSTFDSNQASNSGGALYVFNGESEINNSTFENNSAGFGGAINLTSGGRAGQGIMTVNSSTFTENTTIDGEGGGAIYLNEAQSLTINGSEFTRNFGAAEIGGGALAVEGSFSNLSADDCLFSANDTDGRGGAIKFESGGMLSIENSDFDDNTSNGDGGGIYFASGSTSIYTSSFLRNVTEDTGGAIYATTWEVSETFTITNCQFNENESQGFDENGDGGAVYVTSVDTDIEDSQFTNNTSANRGGGVYHSGGFLGIDNSTFSNNNSSGAGGGLNARSSEVVISNSTFSGNEADERGGGINIRQNNSTDLIMVNSTVSGNTSGSTGGGLHYGPQDAEAQLLHCTIYNNSATDSGGGVSIFVDDSNPMTLWNTIIAGNTDGDDRPDITANVANEGGDMIQSSDGFLSLGYNIIGDLGGYEFNNNTTGDQYGDTNDTTTPNQGAIESSTAIDPKLSVLSDNSGDTQTHALMADSPALDAGSVVSIEDDEILTDQRGVNYVGTPDIGAFEFEGNTAPAIDNSGDLMLTTINEDQIENEGDVITEIESQTDLITDEDGPGEGIAIIAVNDTGGEWQYSLDDGDSWMNMGTPSLEEALLLPYSETTRVRLQPEENFNGTISDALTFKAWDQSTGTAGGTLDVSSFSTESAFSEASETISITVTPVNDDPIVVNEIPDQEIPLGSYSFTFNDNVFSDVEGSPLTYSVESLPDWLTFDPASRTFSGNLVSGTSGSATMSVFATDSEGGSTSDSFTISINPLLAVGHELKNNLEIYPIPTSGNLNISISAQMTGEMKFKVLDQVGREVLSRTIPSSATKLNTSLDLSALRNGIYFLQLEVQNKITTKRFLKN